MKTAKLSVVMTNYNHAQYIAEALGSIVSQSLKPFEIFVCDDASTDNSVEVITEISRNNSIVKFIKNEKNLGVLQNLNNLLSLARGEYVYFAAADDKILPGFFEKSMQLLQQYPQAGLCSTRTLRLDAEGRSKGVLHLPVIPCRNSFVPPSQALLMLYQYGSWMQGNTVIYRKRALIESGGFIPELRAGCDTFACHVIAVKYGACFIPEILTAWRQLDSSYSAAIAKNHELCLEFIQRVKKLMTTTYCDVFPSNFVNFWEKRALLEHSLARSFSLKNASIEDLRRALQPKNLMDNSLFSLKRIFLRIEYIFLKFYLSIRMGLPIRYQVSQKLKHLIEDFLAMFSKKDY